MNLKGLRVYCLEDEPSDFQIISEELRSKGAIVIPENKFEWQREMEQIIAYLSESRKRRKELLSSLQEMLVKKNIQLFIMDYFLKGEDPNFLSTDIYDHVLKTDSVLRDIPVIFLSRAPRETLMPIGSGADYVQKPVPLNKSNKDLVYEELVKKASLFPSLVTAVSYPEPVKNEPELHLNDIDFNDWITANF